jgi:hypothetical protein
VLVVWCGALVVVAVFLLLVVFVFVLFGFFFLFGFFKTRFQKQTPLGCGRGSNCESFFSIARLASTERFARS